jgi:hypothetical protein
MRRCPELARTRCSAPEGYDQGQRWLITDYQLPDGYSAIRWELEAVNSMSDSDSEARCGR